MHQEQKSGKHSPHRTTSLTNVTHPKVRSAQENRERRNDTATYWKPAVNIPTEQYLTASSLKLVKLDGKKRVPFSLMLIQYSTS